MRGQVETESVRAHLLPRGRGGRMCDEDRGEQDGQGHFFWRIASRCTRLRRFLLPHPVECRSSKLAGTPCLESVASCGAKHQSDIYTRLAQEPFAVFRPSQPYRRSPSGSAAIAVDPILSSGFQSVANHIRVAVRSLPHLFSLEGCVEKWHSIRLALGLQDIIMRKRRGVERKAAAELPYNPTL